MKVATKFVPVCRANGTGRSALDSNQTNQLKDLMNTEPKRPVCRRHRQAGLDACPQHLVEFKRHKY